MITPRQRIAFAIHHDLFATIFSRPLPSRRFGHRTHYEVLGLPRDCPQSDIKKAFIELSKKHHPDKSDPSSHDAYVKIVEAYRTLGKRSSRAHYDLSLSNSGDGIHQRKTYGFRHYGVYPDPYADPSFYKNRDQSEFENSRPYYGIKGVNRISNFKFASFLVFAMIVLGIIKTIAMNKLLDMDQKRRDIISMKNSQTYNEVKAKAISVSTEEHLDKIMSEYMRNRKW